MRTLREALSEILARARPVAEERPREPRCPKCCDAGLIYADYPPTHPLWGSAQDCPDCTLVQRREKRLRQLRDACGMPKSLQRATFADLGTNRREWSTEYAQAFKETARYAQDPCGWLVLWGPPGTGKTRLAAATVNAALACERPAVWVTVPDLLDWLRAAYSAGDYDERSATLRQIDLLALDELGIEHATPWAREKLYQLLNHRLEEELPTVITTNTPPHELDERFASRLCAAGFSKRVYCGRSDLRQRLGPRPPSV